MIFNSIVQVSIKSIYIEDNYDLIITLFDLTIGFKMCRYKEIFYRVIGLDKSKYRQNEISNFPSNDYKYFVMFKRKMKKGIMRLYSNFFIIPIIL